MESEKEVILYYPYIEITDPSLIKTAALYWDEIRTIVPSGIENYYSTQYAKEAKDNGFLKPQIIHSKLECVKKAGTEFVQDFRADDKIKQMILKLVATKKLDELDYPDYISFDMEKIDITSLWHLCQDLSDVKISLKFHDGQNLAFPKPLFFPYMSRLASVLAEENKAMPLTNETQYHNIMLDRHASYTEERKQNQAQLANMSLQTLSIDSTVPLIEILRFRENHRELLCNFRRQIREMTRQIATGLNTTKKQSIFEEIIQDKVLPLNNEIKAKLSESDIMFGFSLFDIAQATLMGFISSGLEGWITGIAGTTISLTVSLSRKIREDRGYINDHPFGYLYKAHQELGTNN